MIMYFPIILMHALCVSSYSTFAQDCSRKIGTVEFSGYESNISKDIKSKLKKIADSIKQNTTCKIEITGYCGNSENTRLTKSNWDRVNNVIDYMVKNEGINADRFIFRYGEVANACNNIDLSFTPNIIDNPAPPHPKGKN